MELWRLCFEDTEEFIQWYFARKYRDENALIYRDTAQRALAALQMLPYSMTFAGGEVNTSYISGACTCPESRNQGIMTVLLHRSLQIMLERGIALTTLIPQESWLFEYYRKSGYAPVFDYTLKEYTVKEQMKGPENVSCLEENPGPLSLYFDYFTDRMGKRNCCVQHDKEDFNAILEDLYIGGGRLFVAGENNEQVQGMAFVQLTGAEIRVDDWLYDSVEVKESLLQKMANVGGNERIIVRELPETGNARHRGMARIVNVAEMLKRYASFYPSECFTLELADPVLLQNAGTYVIDRGVVRKESLSGNPPLLRLNIEELTHRLLKNHQERPFISLMLD